MKTLVDPPVSFHQKESLQRKVLFNKNCQESPVQPELRQCLQLKVLFNKNCQESPVQPELRQYLQLKVLFNKNCQESPVQPDLRQCLQLNVMFNKNCQESPVQPELHQYLQLKVLFNKNCQESPVQPKMRQCLQLKVLFNKNCQESPVQPELRQLKPYLPVLPADAESPVKPYLPVLQADAQVPTTQVPTMPVFKPKSPPLFMKAGAASCSFIAATNISRFIANGTFGVASKNDRCIMPAKLHITLKIHNITFKALLNKGASVCLINLKTFNKLKNFMDMVILPSALYITNCHSNTNLSDGHSNINFTTVKCTANRTTLVDYYFNFHIRKALTSLPLNS